MKSIKVVGKLRENFGKSSARALRREGRILCELYGGKENRHFTVELNDVRKLVYTSQFSLVDVELEGKVYQSIIKEIQFHPVEENIQHIDFQELVPGRKIKVSVPIQIEGISPGVKEGGKLVSKVRYLKIKTTPENLVDSVKVDISEVMLGQSVRIRDIQVGEGIEVMSNPGIPVASVEVPRLLKGGVGDEDEEGDEAEEEGESDSDGE